MADVPERIWLPRRDAPYVPNAEFYLTKDNEDDIEYVRVHGEGDATCEWKEDSDGVWWTGCDNAHEFTEGGPTENKQRFCGYCGKSLKETRHVYDDSERRD